MPSREFDAIDIQTVGVILMVVGFLGLILSLLYTFMWAPQARPGRGGTSRISTSSPRAVTEPARR